MGLVTASCLCWDSRSLDIYTIYRNYNIYTIYTIYSNYSRYTAYNTCGTYLPLQVSVLYAGAGLRVTWHTAVARAVVGGVTRVRTAAGYRLAVAATKGEV